MHEQTGRKIAILATNGFEQSELEKIAEKIFEGPHRV